MFKLNSIKPNPDNPRVATPEAIEDLKKSIEADPELLEYNQITYNKEKLIIKGNQRYKCLIALGYKEVPNDWVKDGSKLSKEKQRKLMIIDNTHAGSWDWKELEKWDDLELKELGIDVPELSSPEKLVRNKKKKISIEIKTEAKFKQAKSLINFFLSEGVDVGEILIKALREEKKK